MAFPQLTKVHHREPYASIDPTLPALSTSGKSVVITGGGSGIGPRIAHAFALSGSKQIVLLGRTSSSLEKTKASLEAEHAGLKVLTFVADITDAAAVNSAFSSTRSIFGPIDIFIANAAFLPEPMSIADTKVEDFVTGLDINVKASLITTQAFLANAAADAVLIHVSTGMAHLIIPNFSGYIVSKMAALKFFELVQLENPQVRVMSVHPGYLHTDMNVKGARSGIKGASEYDDMELPGHFMVWLASKEAEFLKGKFVWSSWDVEELKARKEEFEGTQKLTMTLNGWPQ